MDIAGVVLIVILVLVLLIIITVVTVGVIAYRKAKEVTDTVKDYSNAIFGTQNPFEGMKKVEMEGSKMPKSVSGATHLYLPQIMRDFPEFHLDEMKGRVENVLVSYLRSIDEANPELLTEGMEELKAELLMRIQMNRDRGVKENFQRIHVHQTEIYQYRKAQGRCSVVFQTSVEYLHFVEKAGKIIEGRDDLKTQSKYNVELVYVQDRETVANIGESGLGLNCPNCGAPLESLGSKVCRYCDTPVVEFNIKTWGFSSVKEV